MGGGPGQRLVGVVGGVGPAATVAFLDRIVNLTDAASDQEHVDLLVYQHSSIPDRTAFILGQSTDDPGPVMAQDAVRLERAGVDFIVVPCNTASYFTRQVKAAVEIEVLSIVGQTVGWVREVLPDAKRVGVMATSGTAKAGVYQDALAAEGLTAVLPDGRDQEALTAIIYDEVKAGLPVDVERFHGIIDHLLQSADVVVLGCTELSVAHDSHPYGAPKVIDSLDALARATILRAGHQLRA